MLEGTWIVHSITLDTLSTSGIPHALIQQGIELKKRTYIVVHSDHQIEFVSPGSIHTGYWRLGSNQKSIISRFDDAQISDSVAFEFLSSQKLIINTMTRFGRLKTIYLKDGDATSF